MSKTNIEMLREFISGVESYVVRGNTTLADAAAALSQVEARLRTLEEAARAAIWGYEAWRTQHGEFAAPREPYEKLVVPLRALAAALEEEE